MNGVERYKLEIYDSSTDEHEVILENSKAQATLRARNAIYNKFKRKNYKDANCGKGVDLTLMDEIQVIDEVSNVYYAFKITAVNV